MSDLAKGRLCVVHNNICEASSKLEIVEQRIVTYLVSMIEKDDEDFKDYTMNVKVLAGVLGIKRKDFYDEVKKTTKKLMGKVMSLKHLDGKKGELQVAWLCGADYQDGKGEVILSFHKGLKPYLLQLKSHFTKFPLEEVIKFKSRFSMPTYLLLKQYLSIGQRRITIEDFKKSLQIEDQFELYGHLKTRVITMAVNEINKKTSLNVSFEEIREGRKVVSLLFFMNSKPIELKTIELFLQDDEIARAKAEVSATLWGRSKKAVPGCPKCQGKGKIIFKIGDTDETTSVPCDCCKY